MLSPKKYIPEPRRVATESTGLDMGCRKDISEPRLPVPEDSTPKKSPPTKAWETSPILSLRRPS